MSDLRDSIESLSADVSAAYEDGDIEFVLKCHMKELYAVLASMAKRIEDLEKLRDKEQG